MTNPSSSAPRPIVIGAGLAGLSCTRELHRAGLRPLLIEAGAMAGGRIRTDEVDGFLLDRGFQVLNDWYPEARRQLDLGALRLRAFEPGALVRVGQRFHRVSDPFRQPLDALRGVTTPIGSFADKLRVAKLRSRCATSSGRDLLRRPETSTRQALAAAGFSDRMVDHFFEPFLGGVFLEPELATSSRWFDLAFRSFSLGLASLPAAGMQAVPQQIRTDLPAGSVQFRCSVRSIRADGRAVLDERGTEHVASAIVIATEPAQARRLLQNSGRSHTLSRSDEASRTLAAEQHRSVRCFSFDAPHAPVDRPLLVLNGNRRHERARWGEALINNLSVPSKVQPTYAPPGRHLISVTTLVESPLTEPSNERRLAALESDVRLQLSQWFGPRVESWRTLRIQEIPFALPSQEPGAFGPKPPEPLGGDPIYLAGDYRETTSIHGALVSGRKTAAAVIERLRQSVT